MGRSNLILSMKVSQLTQQELIVQVEIAVQAALSIPELTTAFQGSGIDENKIQVGRTLTQEVITWQDRQTGAANNLHVAQTTFRTTKEKINSLYTRHLEVARFLYREDEEMRRTLQLAGARRTRFADWIEQVRTFYARLNVKALAPLGVSGKEINEAKTMISQLAELQVLRNDARRQSQQTTRSKQMAVNDLRAWFRRFVNASEFVCQEDPQLLESMGIVVPS